MNQNWLNRRHGAIKEQYHYNFSSSGTNATGEKRASGALTWAA